MVTAMGCPPPRVAPFALLACCFVCCICSRVMMHAVTAPQISSHALMAVPKRRILWGCPGRTSQAVHTKRFGSDLSVYL